MSNDISTLRAHLFDEIKALRDGSKGASVERAKAVSDLAQTIINTAKVELQFMDQMGRKTSEFIPANSTKQIRSGTVEHDESAGITRHLMS